MTTNATTEPITEVTPVIEQHITTQAWVDPPRGSSRDQWLHSWRRENLLLGGRGTQKTGHGWAKLAFQALVINGQPNTYSVATEQTAGDVDDTLVPQLRELINPELYTLKGSKRGLDVHWISGHVTRLRSRQARRRHDDPPFRGPSACYVWHDEIARDRDPTREDRDVISISAAMLRGEAGRLRAMDYTTTPQANWFYRHALGLGVASNDEAAQIGKGAAAYYEATRDVDPILYRDLLGRYSGDFAAQELEARWVPLEGRVWRGYRDAPWPAGNTDHWAAWDPNLPWVLGVDLGGAESAWIIGQYHEAVDEAGTRVFPGRVLVAVAEFTPSALGSFHILPEIAQTYGQHYIPATVCIGHDVGSPGNRGDASTLDFVQHGWDRDIRLMTGWRVKKEAQHQVGSTLILDSAGRRRFAISRDFKTHYPQGRGLREMFLGYTFPPPGSATYFDKDKGAGAGFEDINDAFCYLAMGLHGDEFYVRTSRHAG